MILSFFKRGTLLLPDVARLVQRTPAEEAQLANIASLEAKAPVAQAFISSTTFAPTGQIHSADGRRVALAAYIERFGSTHVTVHLSGRAKVAVGQRLRGSFIIGTQGPFRVALHVETQAHTGECERLGTPSYRIVAQLERPSRKLLAALGQYALQFAHSHHTLPEPRTLVKAGFGLISLGDALEFERPRPHQQERLDEVAKLRCEAFSRYQPYAPEQMLDAWDNTPGSGQIVVARLRGRIVGTLRNAYPHGPDKLLPLLSYMPHVRGQLPRGKVAELGRKAGDTAFWWGDMFPQIFAQAMRDGLAAGYETLVASVQTHELARYVKLGFSDTKLRGELPTEERRACGVISINLVELWTGRLGFGPWRALAASAEHELPAHVQVPQTLRDAVRLFFFRRYNRLLPAIENTRAARGKVEPPRAAAPGAPIKWSARA